MGCKYDFYNDGECYFGKKSCQEVNTFECPVYKKYAQGFLYDIVLTNGLELRCYSDLKHEDIMGMYLKDDIFIVRENNHPKKNTYVLREKVSHIRFDQKDDGERVAF